MWLELAIWLVVQCAHLEKYEFVNGKGYPIYKGKKLIKNETTNYVLYNNLYDFRNGYVTISLFLYPHNNIQEQHITSVNMCE